MDRLLALLTTRHRHAGIPQRLRAAVTDVEAVRVAVGQFPGGKVQIAYATARYAPLASDAAITREHLVQRVNQRTYAPAHITARPGVFRAIILVQRLAHDWGALDTLNTLGAAMRGGWRADPRERGSDRRRDALNTLNTLSTPTA